MSGRAIQIGVLALSAALLVGAALWSLRPLPSAEALLAERTPPGKVHPSNPAPLTSARHVALDSAAFGTPLWVAPPAPAAPPTPTPPPPPPPPLRLQLIAIITEPVSGASTEHASPTAVLSALFYDPDADRLVTFQVGDSLGGTAPADREIQAITDKGVIIRDGRSTRTIALREDPPTDLFAPKGAAGGERSP